MIAKIIEFFIHELISVIWYVLSALYTLKVAISFSFWSYYKFEKDLTFCCNRIIIIFSGYFLEKINYLYVL